MKKILFSLLSITSFLVSGQDPQFSQYYSSPLYLNPAFSGTTNDHRFIANYRNQWPNIARGFQTYAFSYDYNLNQYNSGVGFLMTTDKAGTAGLKSTQLNLQYSYKIHVSKKWVLASGLNFGYAFRSIDYTKLIFRDQLQFDASGNTPTDDPAAYNLTTTRYFDFGTGLLAYNKTFWFGLSATHLNQPNHSMTGDETTLPIKTTIHGGVRIPLSGRSFARDHVTVFSPSFVYKRQGRFDQLDLGADFLYDPISIGFWYRGIPIKQNTKDNISQDAIVVILGFHFQKIEMGYSYDFTVSELGPSSGGTHEVSLKYKMAIVTGSRHKHKERFIPCPSFYQK
jgi:type IX secretion system PorP/SprF family membrane protein